jgi:hypothetical protein
MAGAVKRVTVYLSGYPDLMIGARCSNARPPTVSSVACSDDKLRNVEGRGKRTKPRNVDDRIVSQKNQRRARC